MKCLLSLLFLIPLAFDFGISPSSSTQTKGISILAHLSFLFPFYDKSSKGKEKGLGSKVNLSIVL